MLAAREYWSKHLAAIAAEGVATKVYSEREGLSVASLYAWRRRLKVAAVREASLARPAGPRFVPVQVVAGGSRAPCTLTFASDLRVELQELPAPAWLAALAATLAEVR